MRIDGGGRKSAAGRGGAHALGAVLSLLSQGRRAEQAGDYSRAAYYSISGEWSLVRRTMGGPGLP